MAEMEIRRFKALEYQANEAINTLCTNLFFAGGDIRKIMVTSCHPQEGKSYIAMNLMRSMSKLGMKVVLVDADIRASAIQGAFDVKVKMPDDKPYPGLTRYLAGHCGMKEILAQTNFQNAWMVLSGKNVVNSLPLLNTPRMETLLNALAKEFDLVIVDAPPVGTIIDAARIASWCDGTLFVIQSGAVSGYELRGAMQQIERTGCPILGCVLNRSDERRHDRKYYYQSDRQNKQLGLKGLKYGAAKKAGGRKGKKEEF